MTMLFTCNLFGEAIVVQAYIHFFFQFSHHFSKSLFTSTTTFVGSWQKGPYSFFENGLFDKKNLLPYHNIELGEQLLFSDKPYFVPHCQLKL